MNAALVAAFWVAAAGEGAGSPTVLDLPTTLRLAGAENLDVRIARERLAEARAVHTSAVWQFFPWISIGAGYRGHHGALQDVVGKVIDVSKYSYNPGLTVAAQLDLGDAIYKELSRKQLVRAAEHSLEERRQTAVLSAASAYFDLLVAQRAVGITEEARKITDAYKREVSDAVGVGIALKADELRVKVQAERHALAVRQAAERRRAAAARLAQTLHLDPSVELQAEDADLVPLSLVDAQTPLDVQVQAALRSHSAIKQGEALVEAAESERKEVAYGPLIPTLGAQAFFGGLGGGPYGGAHDFGGSVDYAATLQWRIGPGGLLDQGRLDAARARSAAATFASQKARDEVTRQVVDAWTRTRSQADQLETARQALATAEESLNLTRQRKEFAVANVLENILAEQDLTRARNDYLTAIGEYDKAQFALKWATGGLEPTR